MPFVHYSPETKVHVVRWTRDRIPFPEICRRLAVQVSKRSVRRWMALYESTRAVVRDPDLYEPQGAPRKLTTEETAFLLDIIREDPTLYIDEAQEAIYQHTGKWPSYGTIWRQLHEQLSLTLKTGRTVNPKQNPAKRARFLVEIAHIRPEWMVFADESGIGLDDERRRYAWAPVGKRTDNLLRPTRQKRLNLVTGIALSGLVGNLVKHGTVKRRHFRWFLKKRLLPFMNPFPNINSVLILDNARIHKGPEIARLCEDYGVKLVFLPPYSPDFNPIEKGFSVFKAYCRRHKIIAHSSEVIEDLYKACSDLLTESLCFKLFAGSAYV